MPSPASGQLSSWRMATTWPGIARAEVVERVVAGDAGHAGDQEGQRDRFVDARDHAGIVAENCERRVGEIR